MAERVGFSHAVLAGLRMATTEYVMVVQHDNAFIKPFDLGLVLDFMHQHSTPYVKLPLSTVFRHLNRCQSSYQLDMRARAIPFAGGEFIPLMYWYDGSHVAHRETYMKLVSAFCMAWKLVSTHGAYSMAWNPVCTVLRIEQAWSVLWLQEQREKEKKQPMLV